MKKRHSTVDPPHGEEAQQSDKGRCCQTICTDGIACKSKVTNSCASSEKLVLLHDLKELLFRQFGSIGTSNCGDDLQEFFVSHFVPDVFGNCLQIFDGQLPCLRSVHPM